MVGDDDGVSGLVGGQEPVGGKLDRRRGCGRLSIRRPPHGNAAVPRDPGDVAAALSGFDGLWESLFPAEQARIARLLIERVTVSHDGMAVDLRTEGLGSVIRQMVTPKQELAA